MWVVGDDGLLKQCLRVLTDNSLKYSPDGGRITLSVRGDGREARISVQDEGQGIPPRRHRLARRFAGLTGCELVYDLYTGTGTIACFVARAARAVVGIEYVPEAVEAARAGAALNGIDNATFFAGDMKDVLSPAFVEAHGHPDVVITDPPRAGMHPGVVRAVIDAAPARIVYVSCNPATQARDLALLDEAYRVEAVQPVDMFPQTHHVENVVLLTRRP